MSNHNPHPCHSFYMTAQYTGADLTFLPSFCDLLNAEKGAMLVWASLDDDFACILLCWIE